MEKPANAGAHGHSGIVRLHADIAEYASAQSALQARTLSHRFNLSPAVAAVVAAHAFPVTDSWRTQV